MDREWLIQPVVPNTFSVEHFGTELSTQDNTLNSLNILHHQEKTGMNSLAFVDLTLDKVGRVLVYSKALHGLHRALLSRLSSRHLLLFFFCFLSSTLLVPRENNTFKLSFVCPHLGLPSRKGPQNP